MNWQDIVRSDPYLAGSMASHAYDWWDTSKDGPEATAKKCGLREGEEAYTEFLQGWNDELRDVGIRELQREIAEQQEIMRQAEQKGDPEVW